MTWKADVRNSVERFGRHCFSLEEFYADFEGELSGRHPNNRNVQAKIRQQLQVLRDEGYLEFIDYHGQYRLV